VYAVSGNDEVVDLDGPDAPKLLTPVLVNRADWTDAPLVPDGWMIANAPRPLMGEIRWEGKFRRGIFYAANPTEVTGTFGWAADDAGRVVFITDAEIRERVDVKLAEYGYASLEEAGLTVEEVAETMQLPWCGTPASA
jgi:hypothetical protein